MSAYEWALVAGLFLLSAVASYAVLRYALRRRSRASQEPTTPPGVPDAAEHAAVLDEARALRASSEGLLERVSGGSASAADAMADIYDTEL